MIAKKHSYNTDIPKMEALEKISETETTEQMEKHFEMYTDCFIRPQQRKCFEAYQKGLMSNLDRKSIEPIALSFLGEKKYADCNNL